VGGEGGKGLSGAHPSPITHLHEDSERDGGGANVPPGGAADGGEDGVGEGVRGDGKLLEEVERVNLVGLVVKPGGVRESVSV
jgi:hypothetical protein